MKKKQTAVEWFAYNDAQATLDYAEGRITELVFAVQKMAILQQALEMEREQKAEIIKNIRSYGK